ncbi:MAG: hypothetical protein APR62_04270 [Smithella sp. SDB]|nr:MAG: hypothetical protein APR62_04270 [Smithella sp. SDB]
MENRRLNIVNVDESKCTGCGICVEVCPVGAITIDKVAKIDKERCAGCGICVNECPNNAIDMKRDDTSSSYRQPKPSYSRVADIPEPEPMPRRPFAGRSSGSQRTQTSDLLDRAIDFFVGNSGRGLGRGRGSGKGQARGRGGRGMGRGSRRSL